MLWICFFERGKLNSCFCEICARCESWITHVHFIYKTYVYNMYNMYILYYIMLYCIILNILQMYDLRNLSSFKKGVFFTSNPYKKQTWMLKFVKTWTLTFPPVLLTCKSSPIQLSIWERLGYIWCLLFLLTFYSIKKICPIFLIFTASTNITIRKANFEAGCSYKVCNKFVL